MRGGVRWILLPLMLVVSCVPADRVLRAVEPPVRLSVPFLPAPDRLCGPASLASVLHYWQEKADVPQTPLKEIEQAVYLKKIGGAFGMDLARFAREEGFQARFYTGSLSDLLDHLRRDVPLIVFLNLGDPRFPRGHFVVVTGLDAQGVFAHSGTDRDQHIAHPDFMSAWGKMDHWTLEVLPAPRQG